MTTHDLKTWPVYFQAAWAGFKDWEMRYNGDRDFLAGDKIISREYDPIAKVYTGRVMEGTLIWSAPMPIPNHKLSGMSIHYYDRKVDNLPVVVLL